MSAKSVYRVIFDYEEKHYELYVRKVLESNMNGFIEVEGIIIGEGSQLVVDPHEEKLKMEFNGVKRCYIPIHTILRIDEVENEGTPKVMPVHHDALNVSPFPTQIKKPDSDED